MRTTPLENLAVLSTEHRLRRLWQMNVEQRIAAMRRGELSYRELAAWSGRHPEQIPLLNGEFEWLAARTPEACEPSSPHAHPRVTQPRT